MTIKHLDEISDQAFVEMRQAAEVVIRGLLNQMDGRLCQACMCHLLAAAASAIAIEHEDKPSASTH